VDKLSRLALAESVIELAFQAEPADFNLVGLKKWALAQVLEMSATVVYTISCCIPGEDSGRLGAMIDFLLIFGWIRTRST
jgi:hypothetical protein